MNPLSILLPLILTQAAQRPVNTVVTNVAQTMSNLSNNSVSDFITSQWIPQSSAIQSTSLGNYPSTQALSSSNDSVTFVLLLLMLKALSDAQNETDTTTPTATAVTQIKETQAPPSEIKAPKKISHLNIALEGDSLSLLKSTGSYTPYGGILKDRFNGKGATLTDDAISGGTVTGTMTQGISRIAKAYDKNTDQNIIVLWGGTNDLYYGGNAEKTYEGIKNLTQKYKEQGWKVIVATAIQRGDANEATEDGERVKLNNLIRQSTGLWDKTVDLASLPEFLDTNNAVQNNTSIYMPDKTHLTAKGSGLIADQIEKAINDLAAA